jgi:hypothetical protein
MHPELGEIRVVRIVGGGNPGDDGHEVGTLP